MHVLALAIPLTRLLTCSNLCTSAFARGCGFILNTNPDLSPLLAGDLSLHLVVFAHGSGFPFTDATFHEQVEHAHIPPIVIHLELAALEPTEQARADIPSAMKREPVS